VVEILVLLALSAAIVAYLNWSSEVAWTEFLAASKSATPAPTLPIQAVNGRCDGTHNQASVDLP
jgi:hypothetical protein